MKTIKGKSKKHRGKKSARLKTVWYKDENDIPTRAIVPKNINDMKLKDSAIKNAGAFPNSNEHIIEAIKNGVYPPDFKSTKPKSQQKPSASVHCINEAREAKGLEPISTPTAASKRFETQKKILKEMEVYSRWAALSYSNDWYHSKAEQDARVTLELRLHYSGKAGHEYKPDEPKEGEFIPASNPDQLCLPPPDKVSYEMLTQDLIDKAKAKKPNGYSFASRKPEVKTGLTPSGKPISDFVQGGKYAPKLHSVTTELHSAHVAKYRSSANDDRCENTGLRKYPGSSVAGREWYRNNIPPDYTPDIVHEFDALERDLSKALVDKHLLAEDNFELQEENEQLKERLYLLEQELYYSNWELSITKGEDISDRPASDKVKSLSTASLANLFNVFAVRHRDNPLHAFCTVHGVSIEQEQELRAYIKLRKQQRNSVYLEREWCKVMSEKKPIVHSKSIQRAQRIRELRALKRETGGYTEYLTDKVGTMKMYKERLLYRKWSRRDVPTWQGLLDNRAYLHNAVKRYEIRADKRDRFDAMKARVEQRELDRALMRTTTYKVLKGIKDVMLMEVNPFKIAANRREKKRAIELDRQAEIAASKIKELQEKKAEEQEMRQRIREAQRLAH